MVENRKKTQKAFVMTGPGGQRELKTDHPIPVPQKGEVLVKVECFPINPSDTYAFDGHMAAAAPKEINVGYPFVPGWEGAGTVI